jgi:hypothetical protein
MAKIDASIPLALAGLKRSELEKLVLKAASKDKVFHDYLLVNYGDTESGEKELYEQALADFDIILAKRHKGFSDELKMANALQACNKRIDEFAKVCKNKKYELDLVMYLLEKVFYNSSISFGTCFTNYDYRVTLLLRKAINLLTKKMHEDYKIDYAEELNHYLSKLKGRANYFDFVDALPNSI